jgi:hypothetical protein
MRARALNPNAKGYHNYGGRGITVCERWVVFTNFLADMGERPSGTSLDRIDNNKGYEPGNCRWATPKEQNRGRRVTRLIEYQGRTQCLKDWAEEFGISETGLTARLARGLSVEEALTKPLVPAGRYPRSAVIAKAQGAQA